MHFIITWESVVLATLSTPVPHGLTLLAFLHPSLPSSPVDPFLPFRLPFFFLFARSRRRLVPPRCRSLLQTFPSTSAGEHALTLSRSSFMLACILARLCPNNRRDSPGPPTFLRPYRAARSSRDAPLDVRKIGESSRREYQRVRGPGRACTCN